MVMRDVEVDGKARRVPSVIAGYHWFADWGRDTMIALPGLALPTGRAAEAAETIRAFALFVREGLLPNNFPDAGSTPDYNTVDATLWMFQAIASLTEAAGDLTLVQELYPVLSDIIAWHVRGTRYNIRMDPHDGLLSAGEPGVQLTWMDAKVDGWVVTPRTGKPVEINALWHNALRLMAGWRKALGRNARPGKEERHDCKALAKRARDSFRERFWYEEGGYLYDVVDGPDGDDPSLRPNQLLALSLDPDLVGKPQALKILDAVRRNLLTPYGPRTLSPDDPEYKGTYKGDRAGRDGAYHQGTAWTWLLGPYFDALRAVEGNAAAGRLWSLMLPYVRAHLADAGLGTISEIFDAEAPYAPRGCVSQAWSVSELLRIMNFEL
jgi:predicted glycogen debranching enzyme